MHVSVCYGVVALGLLCWMVGRNWRGQPPDVLHAGVEARAGRRDRLVRQGWRCGQAEGQGIIAAAGRGRGGLHGGEALGWAVASGRGGPLRGRAGGQWVPEAEAG